MKKLLGVLLCLLILSKAQAQSKSAEIGLALGTSFYTGDIAPRILPMYFDYLYPAIGIFTKINLHPSLSLRAGLTQARVGATDENSPYPERMLQFRTPISELALTAEFSPVQFGGYRPKVLTAPYFYAGIAGYHFNPQAYFDDSWIDLQPLGTEGQGLPEYGPKYSRVQVAVPFGLGIKCTVRQSWSVGLEFGGRMLFNDHLDDISGKLINHMDIYNGNGPVAARLSNPEMKEPRALIYRRGGEFRDWYYIGAVTFSFRLVAAKNRPGRGMGCPKF
jgi:hypothetical protein